MDVKAAGDYASSQALTKQVKATRNSKGETIYVTPFRYINEDYVLHDGNGNPYMNPNLEYVWDEDDWDVYKAIFSRKLRQDYSVDISGQTGMVRLHISSPVVTWMIRGMEIASITNGILSVRI